MNEEEIGQVEANLTVAEKVLAGQLRAQADRLDRQAGELRAALERTVRTATKCREAADRLDPPKPPAPYEPRHHQFKIGQQLRVLKDSEFSWGWSPKAGEIWPITSEKDLRRVDFPGVGEFLEGVEAETVDLAAALWASVEAAKARREASRG